MKFKKAIHLLFPFLLILFTALYCHRKSSLLSKAHQPKALLWADEELANMTLEERIGQLFIYTVTPRDSAVYRRKIKACAEKYHVGGLLFSEGTLKEHITLTNYMQSLSKVPAFITFDGEWGLSMRIKKAPLFPKNCALGCIQDHTLLYEYGKEVARQAHLAGIHVNFAPVADIHTNAFNPVISYRSFGENPERVAKQISAYAQGLEDGNVLSVSKHFPGHGDTQSDSHKTLPTLNFDKQRLNSVELVPFKQIITDQLGGIMVGHLLVKALDAQKSTSLSATVIDTLLKQKLGFKGLIFTDALAMSGVSGSKRTCVEAIKAGNDLLLAPSDIGRAYRNVKKAVLKGEISRESIDKRCRKVLAFKYALGLPYTTPLSFEKAKAELQTKKTTLLLSKLYKAAITVVQKEKNLLPLQTKDDTIAVITLGPWNSARPFIQALEKKVKVLHYQAPFTQTKIKAIQKELPIGSPLFISLTAKKLARYKTIIAQMPKNIPTIYILFTDLTQANYIADAIPHLSGMLLAHTIKKEVQEQTANVILGKASADGKLSSSIIGWFKEGEGSTLYSK